MVAPTRGRGFVGEWVTGCDVFFYTRLGSKDKRDGIVVFRAIGRRFREEEGTGGWSWGGGGVVVPAKGRGFRR